MELELLPFSHSQILPAWSLPEDKAASLEDNGNDLNLEDFFCADDLLPPWIGNENKGETLLSENLQDFWGDPLCCKQNEQNNALTIDLEDDLSSTFLLPTLTPSTSLSVSDDCNQPNDLLSEGFEDLWDTPLLLTEDISDIANSSLDESFSSSLISSSSSPPLISSPLLPAPFLLQEHDYSLSPSLLPSVDETNPKVSGGKSILKRVTRNIHLSDIIQGHKKVLQSRPLNQSKKQLKTHSQKEHNERERFRRGHLKLELERLRDLLPSLTKSKRPAKKEILDSATIYCLTLATRLEALKMVRNREKSRQENLKVKIARASETVTTQPSKHLSK